MPILMLKLTLLLKQPTICQGRQRKQPPAAPLLMPSIQKPSRNQFAMAALTPYVRKKRYTVLSAKSGFTVTALVFQGVDLWKFLPRLSASLAP